MGLGRRTFTSGRNRLLNVTWSGWPMAGSIESHGSSLHSQAKLVMLFKHIDQKAFFHPNARGSHSALGTFGTGSGGEWPTRRSLIGDNQDDIRPRHALVPHISV